LLGSGLGRDDESSTAYYAYVDGERYVLSKNPHLLLRMAGARGINRSSANTASTMSWTVGLLGLAAVPMTRHSIV